MYKPKLVLFDFGGTLIDDSDYRPLAASEALRLAADNPEDTTSEILCDLWRSMDERLSHRAKSDEAGYELDVQLSGVLRNILAVAGLRYSIDLAACEAIFDRAHSVRKATPHMAQLLQALDAAGIRTAVISNTMMSGEAMAVAVKEHFPQSKMEFVITSADYMFCKPAPEMFVAATKTAGVEPSECWYLGDTFGPDVVGAHGIDILPVLYESESDIPFERKEREGKAYYVVNSWLELVKRIS
ncbi:MAG TPA: HAD family hydrolase [Clostridia bacterium]|nr:HAD family hydrolase [Clostridia bacterium]